MKKCASGWRTLKSKINKLNIGILGTTPADLIKLGNLVKYEVVKKTEYNAKIKDIEDKILDITNLATNTTLNAKINEVKKKPCITDLATTTAPNAKITRLKTKYLILLT